MNTQSQETREFLVQQVADAKRWLSEVQALLDAFDSAAENNMFDTVDQAMATIEEKLRGLAHEDCEGSYNCGQEEYAQDFIVDGVTYTGKLVCEYNRHDKTYYFLDHGEFSYAVKT